MTQVCSNRFLLIFGKYLKIVSNKGSQFLSIVLSSVMDRVCVFGIWCVCVFQVFLSIIVSHRLSKDNKVILS